MQAFHDCLDNAGVPWRIIDFRTRPRTPCDTRATDDRAGSILNSEDEGRSQVLPGEDLSSFPLRHPVDDRENESHGVSRFQQRDGTRDEGASAVSPAGGCNAAEAERNSSPTVPPYRRFWGLPGDIERVQLCVCGRSPVV